MKKQLVNGGKRVYLVATFMPYEEVINLDEEKLAMKISLYRKT